MSIKVVCPSCGRVGRVPDDAIGKTAQCPGCGAKRKLSAADILFEDLELIEDDGPGAAAATAPSPASARPPREARPAPLAASAAPVRPGASQAPERPSPPSARRLPYIAAGAAAALALLVVVTAVVYLVGSGRRGGEFARAAGPMIIAAAADTKAPATPTPTPASAPAAGKQDGVGTSPPAASGTPPAAGGSTGQADAGFFPPPPGSGFPPPPGSGFPAPPGSGFPAPDPLTPAAPLPGGGAAPGVPPVGAGEFEADFVAAARAAAAALVKKTTPAPTRVMNTADIVAESEPSVALIRGKSSSGTGFLVAPGLLATNAHVIDGEFISSLEVRFPSADDAHKGPAPAELLFEDPGRDLALLAVRTTLPPLRIAQTYPYRKGEDVTVIGNPGTGVGDLVLENAISRGVMSTKADISGQKFYQISIAVNPGNSGGPVFDSKGQVIGVVTLRIPGKEQLSFCIPLEDLRAAIARVGAMSAAEGAAVRSRHRVASAFRAETWGGAAYGVALELHLLLGRNPGNPTLNQAVDHLDKAISLLEGSLLAGLGNELGRMRDDPFLVASLRRKMNGLGDNYLSLRTAYERNRSTTPPDSIRSMKASHRQLVADLRPDLGAEIPEPVQDWLDDHLDRALAMSPGNFIPFPPHLGPGRRSFPGRPLGPPANRRFAR